MIQHAGVSFERAKAIRKEDKEKSDQFISQALEKLNLLTDFNLNDDDKEEAYLLWFDVCCFGIEK